MDGDLEIKVYSPEDNNYIIMSPAEGESLLDTLTRYGIDAHGECAGNGSCGKCKIKVLDGDLKLSGQDKSILSDEDLDKGIRLSCMAYPDSSCSITLISKEETECYVVTDIANNITIDSVNDNVKDIVNGDRLHHDNNSTSYTDISSLVNSSLSDSYIVGIDIGTTTIAVSLADKISQRVKQVYTAINPQRRYGADVISRIMSANDGKLITLRDVIRNELYMGICEVALIEGITIDKVSNIIIAGNTTMVHILMGYSCSGIGAYPFSPVSLSQIDCRMKDLFPCVYEVPVTVMPGISVFVGGDITSGLMTCGFDKLDKPCLFIDIGTNGEMAIGDEDRILVSSTAAGPAFEGGNISCGVGSVPGAISQVSWTLEGMKYITIGNKPPIGLCGTGVIELVSELLDIGVIDNTGLMSEPYFTEGYEIAGLRFIQKDIRELQLAKAAIRTGIELLIKRYNIGYTDIDKVFLAGGFGYKLDIIKAVHIGLIPEELGDKVIAVGNTCLSGTIKYAANNEVKESIDHIISVAKEIHLSKDEDFNKMYVEYMSF